MPDLKKYEIEGIIEADDCREDAAGNMEFFVQGKLVAKMLKWWSVSEVTGF